MHKYAVSKAGSALYALQFRNLHGRDGVVSVTLNPGNLSSELQRHGGAIWSFAKLFFYPPVNGAYTELFAGLAPEAAVLKGNEWGKLVYLDDVCVWVCC